MAIGGGGGGGDSPYTTAKTSVWWDIENCQVPRGSDSTEEGCSGVQQALSSTGIALNHVPAGVKDASDKKILVDMLFWAVDNPAPANYLLISGDRDFSNALHQLRMRRYNILLAHAPNVSQALVAAARSVWLWSSLLAGGLPLNKSEPSYLGNAFGSKTSEASNKTVGEPACNDISNVRAEADNHFKGNKQTRKNEALPKGDISKTSSLPENKEGHSIQFQKQMSMPIMSSSEERERIQLMDTTVSSSYSSIQKPSNVPRVSYQSEGRKFNKAPHEFFMANKPRASVGSSNQSHPCGPVNNGNNIFSNTPPQNCQPLRPSAIPPSQPHSSHYDNYGSYPSPQQQSTTPFRPGPPPDFSRHASEYPSHGYQNGPFPPQGSGPPGYMQNGLPFYREKGHGPQFNAMNSNISCNANMGSPGWMSSSSVLSLTGNIQGALSILKANKMTPTEANIADCIRYGMGIHNFNVKMALNCAVDNNMVVMHKLGANLPFYIGKHDKLWKCVNPLDSNVGHPKATWDAIQNFLSSPRGQSAISSTECRYHAATVLKKECLEHLPLGDILQILHVIVQAKNWIVPGFHGWQPLAFTLKVGADSKAGVGIS
ncbi:uncharacterized protein LOC109831463 [Asparagus officinalis]|uniref:uncharacterized protein LOC109831463 n=1 Tax=Asparagus officinalis TaxID=4686 RepID=UPI00098E5B7A|nr:uncharacterized protein LOC109831463 [Asparagus officinalis]